MARKTRSQINAQNRQRYYEKKYQELLENAKNIYNEMNLGGTLGTDTPSIEKIINQAGTRSGLKKPTKKSIQALRKLQTPERMLSGVIRSMPKGSDKIELLHAIREEKESKNKSIKKAKDTIRKEKRKGNKKPATKKERKDETRQVNESIKAIDRVLNQVWAEMNRIRNEIIEESKKNTISSSYRVSQLQNYFSNGKYFVDETQKILLTGDIEKIEKLEKGARLFFETYPGGVERPMLYQRENEITHNVWKFLNDMVKQLGTETSETPSNDSEGFSDISLDETNGEAYYSDIDLDISDLF